MKRSRAGSDRVRYSLQFLVIFTILVIAAAGCASKQTTIPTQKQEQKTTPVVEQATTTGSAPTQTTPAATPATASQPVAIQDDGLDDALTDLDTVE